MLVETLVDVLAQKWVGQQVHKSALKNKNKNQIRSTCKSKNHFEEKQNLPVVGSKVGTVGGGVGATTTVGNGVGMVITVGSHTQYKNAYEEGISKVLVFLIIAREFEK